MFPVPKNMTIFNHYPKHTNPNLEKILKQRDYLSELYGKIYELADVSLPWDDYRTSDIESLLDQRKTCQKCKKVKTLWCFYSDDVLYKDCNRCNQSKMVLELLLNAINEGKIEL